MKSGTRRRSRGFTVVEVLLAVGILSVLLGLAVPSAIFYSRRLKLGELDDSAHAIYMAAQSSLTAMKNAGADISALGGSAGKAPEGVIAIDKAHASALLPDGCIEASVLEGNYVIEADPVSWTVYAVWYWSGDFVYGDAYDPVTTDFSQRMSSGAMVGYYGGSAVSRPSIEAP